MKKTLILALLLLPVWAHAGDHDGDVLVEGHLTGKLPEYHAAVPGAPVVSAKNALESERFWPYSVELKHPWQSLPSGSKGVLIRVEPSGMARVDFGRDGLRKIPLATTDFFESANAIRIGKAEKEAPNLVFAIAPRLLDSRVAFARGFPFDESARKKLFLCVFADPWHQSFPKMARDLEALGNRPDVLTILFPQSYRGDVQVSGQLRAMKWTIPFLYAHLAEPYTKSLLEKETRLPAVSLQTAEGRVIYEGHFGGDALSKLTAALGSAPATGE